MFDNAYGCAPDAPDAVSVRCDAFVAIFILIEVISEL